MSTFKSGRTAHKILAGLDDHARTFSQINDLFPTATAQSEERTKVYRVLQALRDDGLVDKLGSEYLITPEGVEALQALNYGEDFDAGHATQTSVRVFSRSAA